MVATLAQPTKAGPDGATTDSAGNSHAAATVHRDHRRVTGTTAVAGITTATDTAVTSITVITIRQRRSPTDTGG
jgi:hypothetical protein